MEYNEELHSHLTTYNIEKSDWGGMNALISGASMLMLSSIDDKMSSSRIQASIDAELLRDKVSELQYRLVDSITHSGQKIENAIEHLSKELTHELKGVNSSLQTSIVQLDIVNETLDEMSTQLQILIEKISTPNETEALELTNQARINLALEKNDLALEITKKALDISGGTSITVLAFHILTLSLFEDEVSKKEILTRYKNFVNLIDFKLKDKQSKSSVVYEEIEHTVYAVMAVMGYRYEHTVLELTQKLYRALARNEDTAFILAKPLNDEATLKLISHANFLRELHWTVLVNSYVLKSNNIQTCLNCFNALESSLVLIKNELLLILGSYFVKERLLYAFMVDSLAYYQPVENEIIIDKFLASLPHKLIKLDDYDLTLLAWYGRETELKISSELKKDLQKIKKNQKNYIQQNYLKHYDKKEKDLRSKEQIDKSSIEEEKIKLQEMEEKNKKINSHSYSQRIWELEIGAIRIEDSLVIPTRIMAFVIYIFFYHWDYDSDFLFNIFYFAIFLLGLYIGAVFIRNIPRMLKEEEISKYQKLLDKKVAISPQRERIKELSEKEFERFSTLQILVKFEQDILEDYYTQVIDKHRIVLNASFEGQLGESVEELNKFVYFSLLKKEINDKEYFNFDLSEQYVRGIDKVQLGVEEMNRYNSDYVEETKSKEYHSILGNKYRNQTNYLLYTLTLNGLVAEGARVDVTSYNPKKSLRMIEDRKMVLEELA